MNKVYITKFIMRCYFIIFEGNIQWMVDGVHAWMSLSVITGLWTLLCINEFWYLTPVGSHRKMTVGYLRYIDVGQYSLCFLVAGSSRLISVFGARMGWKTNVNFFLVLLGSVRCRFTMQKRQWLWTARQCKAKIQRRLIGMNGKLKGD